MTNQQEAHYQSQTRIRAQFRQPVTQEWIATKHNKLDRMDVEYITRLTSWQDTGALRSDSLNENEKLASFGEVFIHVSMSHQKLAAEKGKNWSLFEMLRNVTRNQLKLLPPQHSMSRRVATHHIEIPLYMIFNKEARMWLNYLLASQTAPMISCDDWNIV